MKRRHTATPDLFNPEPLNQPKPAGVEDASYIIARSFDELLGYLSLADEFALDTETTGLQHDRKMVGMSLHATGQKPMYVPTRHRPHLQLGSFKQRWINVAIDPGVLTRSMADKHFVLHNAKFDIQTLWNEGVEIPTQFDDTMILSWLMNPERDYGHGLDNLLRQFFHAKKLPKPWGEGANAIPIENVPPQEMAPYACVDVSRLIELRNVLLRGLSDRGQHAVREYRELEIPIVRTLARMEQTGVHVDQDKLRAFDAMLKEVEDKTVQEAGTFLSEAGYGLAGIGGTLKLGSGAWLSDLLVDHLGWWGQVPGVQRNKNGDWSTDKDYLESLEEGRVPSTPEGVRFAKIVLRYRQYQKLRSTYTEALQARLDKNGRVHGNFKQTGTATGRLSSSDPNLQNIPRTPKADGIPDIRSLFCAPEGYVLLCCDYSQIELRLLAHYAQDPVLMAAYAKGEDVHGQTRDRMNEMGGLSLDRSDAKVVNFGVAYGMEAFALSMTLGLAGHIDKEGDKLCRLDLDIPWAYTKTGFAKEADHPGRTTLRALIQKFGTHSAEVHNATLRIGCDIAASILDAHKRAHPAVYALKEQCVAYARGSGHIATYSGRWRLLPGVNAKKRMTLDPKTGRMFDAGRVERIHSERAATNTLIQGSAADLVKIAMRRIEKEAGERLKLLLQVHDELVYEVRVEDVEWAKEVVQRQMEGAAKLRVPLVAEPGIGRTWSEAK